MARTKTPTPAPAPTTPDTPPDPPVQEQARPSPVLAWPAEWPVPELPAVEKQRRTRGLPMGPVIAGAGNVTTLGATAAYSAGGPVALAATGVVVAAGATAAVLRRRAAVRRGVAARAGGVSTPRGSRGGGGGGLRSGSTGGLRKGGSGLRRSASGGRSAAGSGSRSGLGRSGSKPSVGPSGSGSGSPLGGGKPGLRGGLFGPSTGRHTPPGRHRPGSDKVSRRQQKKAAAATEKAAKKALKRAAKDLATKTSQGSGGKPGGKAQTLKAAAGRLARAVQKAARPYTAAVRQAVAREAKRARGALWDGVCALAAGAWALMTRGRHGALDRLKNVWKRRRKTRTKTDDTPAAPSVADTVRRPTNTNPTRPSTGGPAMPGGGHHFIAAATEMARAAAAYQPTGMLQVGADFAGLEEALRLHAEAMKTTVENADANQPLHPNIIEIMRQVHILQLKAAELAAELTPAFRQLHDVDIARLENPRTGERMWDVSSNL
ncbi:hypothetical protein [Streptomyces caniscabiei]|uniref:Uncharacterized protein n=1 Tax=Streptomyces caniscabiei TaxID=2746961 RepID=A0ABU4MRM2_9ACTN|nr:hypothetical protein [Streptomyces caniscabiei]MDX2954584.1 hypothetical protein [Streptomyces caniscabiei]MDX3039434.1 hypothetical protein [Streptomyces caniscabiei]